MPVLPGDSQSTLPQAQASELAADPSVSEQFDGREHTLLDESQASNGAQSTLPQTQASELAAEPSEIPQRACLLHRFSERLQNMPVVLRDSQSTPPHAQASELAKVPFAAEQVGILRHWFLLR